MSNKISDFYFHQNFAWGTFTLETQLLYFQCYLIVLPTLRKKVMIKKTRKDSEDWKSVTSFHINTSHTKKLFLAANQQNLVNNKPKHS